MNEIRLGSLFDGIGVFPLAAVRCGIVPAWASEIEKAPISITKRHFPGMAHLGDVTKLNGGDIPPVHIITFGSPCQNLSQIGNRAGLAGEKSSLFFHAIRIIREMREATNGIFPAIAVWENVMGAFFSNDRMDFRAVLSAFTAADISMPASGRWAGAGMVRGHTPDLAWRLMDAQHWASPRLARRQRVFVVADFGGQCSHEILFKPRAVQSISASGGDCWLSAACGDRGSILESCFLVVTGTIFRFGGVYFPLRSLCVFDYNENCCQNDVTASGGPLCVKRLDFLDGQPLSFGNFLIGQLAA